MALKTVEWEERYVKVNKLTDIDVEFISLVPKGANRIPFQIVKSEDDIGDRIMANPSMRPDQQLQALQYAALAKLDEIETGKKGSATSAQSKTKLGEINAALLAQNARLLDKLKDDIAELKTTDTGSTLQTATSTVPNAPEPKTAPSNKSVVGKFSGAFGGTETAQRPASGTQKGADASPSAVTPHRKAVSYGDCFGGGLECSILQKGEGSAPEKAYRLKGDIGEQLGKKGCTGLWEGVFDHSVIQVLEIPLEKSDEPVELPKSKFSFGDAEPLQLKKSDEVSELPKSLFSFGD